MTALGTAVRQLVAILDRLEIPYLIGGSIASGSYGMARQTNDIDLVADFRKSDLQAFFELLSADFYLDPQFVQESIANGRAFNLIHLTAAFKFDFFPAADEFSQCEIDRRRFVVLSFPGLEGMELPVASVEDTVLAKLVWFRKGGEVSDRQWHDVLGVLRVQADRVDRAYLALWADRLGVSDLLEGALADKAG